MNAARASLSDGHALFRAVAERPHAAGSWPRPWWGGLLAIVLLAAAGTPGFAQDAEPAGEAFRIGYVHLQNDPRMSIDALYYQIPVARQGDAIRGAEVAIIDSEFIGREIGVEFTLESSASDNLDALALSIERWVAEGVHFVLADLPAAQLLWLADSVADLPVTLFNVSAPDDTLRGESCRANLIHTIPSLRMLTDAMAQFLADQQWREVLVLRGPSERDQDFVAAFQDSARIAGVDVVDVRDFTYGFDPRALSGSNVPLFTSGIDYDAVFVADSLGTFASIVPYRTRDPRPVIGSAGLVPLAWHWAWERAGAAQLNARFEFQADRRMGSEDWAAWISVRGLVQAVLRTGSTERETLLDYLLSDDLNLDGAKGLPITVRPWDQQMRQPIMLATNNNIVARAPLEGFVHPTNNLDTLGIGEARTSCRL